MSNEDSLKKEYLDLSEQIKQAQLEAAESSSTEEEEVHNAYAQRIKNLLTIVESKIKSPDGGITIVKLDHFNLTSRISREIKDCKVQILLNTIDGKPESSKVNEAYQVHIDNLTQILNKLQ